MDFYLYLYTQIALLGQFKPVSLLMTKGKTATRHTKRSTAEADNKNKNNIKLLFVNKMILNICKKVPYYIFYNYLHV